MDRPITLRTICDDDREFLLEVYASTREDELSVVPWDTAEKDHFIRWQFDAQHKYYQENYPHAQFDVILAGRGVYGFVFVWRKITERLVSPHPQKHRTLVSASSESLRRQQ